MDGWYLSDEEIDQIYDFLLHSGISNFCEIEGNEEGFREETFRFRDMIRAFGNCPLRAADAYREAVASASAAASGTERYTHLMTELFYSRLIQYRWKLVTQYRQRTSVLCRALYRDYLDALNVAAYLEVPEHVAV